MLRHFILFNFAFLIAACSTTQPIRTRRLALVDDNGVERLVLSTSSDQVQINGKIYKRRSSAAGIILNNAKGDEVGGLAVLDDGTSSLTLDGYSKDGVYERVSLFVMPDGRSGVLVKDTKGNVRARIAVDENKNAVMELAGEDEKARISTTVTPQGRVTLTQPKAK